MLDFLRQLCRSEGNLQPVIAVAGPSGFRLASSRHRGRPPIRASTLSSKKLRASSVRLDNLAKC